MNDFDIKIVCGFDKCILYFEIILQVNVYFVMMYWSHFPTVCVEYHRALFCFHNYKTDFYILLEGFISLCVGLLHNIIIFKSYRSAPYFRPVHYISIDQYITG